MAMKYMPTRVGMGNLGLGAREKAYLLMLGRKKQYDESVAKYENILEESQGLAAQAKFLAQQLSAKGVSHAEIEKIVEMGSKIKKRWRRRA